MLALPPPVWTLFYLLIAATASWAYPWRAVVDLQNVPLGVSLVVIGLVPPFWAATLFRREGTELNPMSETNAKLVTRGPFVFTRNPMYLGLVIASLGIAFWVGSLPMFAVLLAVFATTNWGHIPFEEAKMRRQFGTAFDDYTRRVRRWV